MTEHSRRIDWVAAGLLLAGLAARIAGQPFVSHDATESLIPWYNGLSQAGFAVIGSDFSNYNPPYLYLLWLASRVFGPEDPLLAIKTLGILCDIGLCAAVAHLVSRTEGSPVFFARAFAITWCIPTVVINSSVWGQCDALYAAFVVGTVAALRMKPFLALFLFGVALSVKLQAIMVAPAILLLLLGGRIPWKAVPASVAGFALPFVPAALAGRPWSDIVMVYGKQTATFETLSASAPNVWTVIKHFVPANGVWTTVGLGATALTGVVYLIIGRERLSRRSGMTTLEAIFVAAFVFPFLLPKMHDRYFFVADILSVALALLDRRWLRIALLVQIGSLTAYAPFLIGWRWPLLVGVAANFLVFIALIRRWYPPAGRIVPAWFSVESATTQPASPAPPGR